MRYVILLFVQGFVGNHTNPIVMTTRMGTRGALVVFCSLGFLAPAATAQTLGATVRGFVEGSGQPRSGAEIILVNEETNERRVSSSDSDGSYTLSVLAAGPYRLEVFLAGYKTYIRQDITLKIGEETRLDIALEPGAPSEEVLVTAVQGLLQLDSVSVGAVIENPQIVDLPLDGRNFLELSLLVPGTAPSAQGSPGSIRGEFTVNVNGAREDANNFVLDGVYNGDPKLNTVSISPPVDAIREFGILASTYDASFGRSGGAQISIALKSGTNRFHGTVYGFFRNGAMDARNFFAPSGPKPKYQRNQFGFSLGGPVRRDRTFFFVDYEGRRLREGITRETNVPSMAERMGDFSGSLFPKPIDPFTQQPFPDGVIPELRMSDVGRAIVALYPSPNSGTPGQNFVSSPVVSDRDDRFDIRLDHALTESSNLIFRYSFSDRDLFEPFSGPTFARIPGYGTDIPRRAQNAMVGENHVFSPTLINEFRFAFNRVAFGATHENQGTSLNQLVGLPELSSNPRDFGLSFITVSGYSPLGDEFNNPQHSVTNVYQLLDNVTHIRGRHLIKFGFDFRALQQNAFRDVQSRGFLTFSNFGQITGNALADLLLGFPFLTGGARLDNHQHLRTKSWNFYFQDSVRLHKDFTLLMGMRYEYNSPPVDQFDRANIYDAETGSLVGVGTNGVPRSAFEPDRNNWAPRFGIAWAPGGRKGTVVHAGYGIYYDQSSLAPGEGLYFNNPFFDFKLYFSLPGLPLTVDNPFPESFPFPLPISALGFQRDLRTAYFQQWNFKLQQEFGAGRILEFGYVGSKGTKILSARDINQPAASPIIPNFRPNPRFDDVIYLGSRGGSTYHSFQTRFQQRFHAGLSLLAAYTFSKSLDDTSTFFPSFGDPNFPQNSSNVRAEKGRSNFDVRHRFSLSYSWELPFGKGRRFLADRGWGSTALGNWQIMGIVTLQTGRPFTVALLPEIDNSNTGRAVLGFGANDRPNRLASGAGQGRTAERWFDTEAFRFSEFGTFGDSGRNILDGPGFTDISFSILKQGSISEAVRLQFRAEFFNLFNNTNFGLPDIFLGSPTFGRVLSAEAPRRIQFGLKFLF